MELSTFIDPQEQRFPTGHLVLTHSVNELARQGRLDPARYLARHLTADWGDLSDDDWAANDRALRTGEDRLLSSYQIAPDLTLWIITEWDRSVTTLLVPSDY